MVSLGDEVIAKTFSGKARPPKLPGDRYRVLAGRERRRVGGMREEIGGERREGRRGEGRRGVESEEGKRGDEW